MFWKHVYRTGELRKWNRQFLPSSCCIAGLEERRYFFLLKKIDKLGNYAEYTPGSLTLGSYKLLEIVFYSTVLEFICKHFIVKNKSI